MKLLRITAEGLPLFKEKLDICFYAQQRVSEDQKEILYPLFSNIYLNPANGFIGINASGKTSVLKVILLALKLINNEPINHIETRDILGNTNKVVLNIFFYSEIKREICRLETLIASKQTRTEGTVYKIVSEKLWAKPADEITTRKSMLDFDRKEPVLVRSGYEVFLPNDVSIIIAHNKNTGENVTIVNLLLCTNMNVSSFAENIPAEIISFLDPSIESLKFEEDELKKIIHLKFKGKEEIVMNNPIELNTYLSSGTLKGIITFTLAQEVLQNGGYIVIDEVESHLHKEIVIRLMKLFMDSKKNSNGATLFFSTHYPELLDEYDRNDSIYIVRNRDGITVDNLCMLLKRNDIKKSDAYQSGILEGVNPVSETYMRLKALGTEVKYSNRLSGHRQEIVQDGTNEVKNKENSEVDFGEYYRKLSFDSKKLFKLTYDEIKSIAPDVNPVHNKRYVSFKVGNSYSSFAAISANGNGLYINTKIDPEIVVEKDIKTKDITKGNGATSFGSSFTLQFIIHSEEQLYKAMPYIRGEYEKNR